MSDLVRIGGIQPLMRSLLDAGLLHGGCLTVTGKTLAQNLRASDRIRRASGSFDRSPIPIKPEIHLVVLYGNLAPEGAVAKITGKEGLQFSGRARVFDGEEATLQAILDGTVMAGDVLIVRYEGPRGGPGMREMLSPTAAIMGKGLGDKVASSPTGGFRAAATGLSWVTSRPRPTPGARWRCARRRPDHDRRSSSRDQSLDDGADARCAQARWRAPAPYATRGVLAKYAQLVSSASLGAVTDR